MIVDPHYSIRTDDGERQPTLLILTGDFVHLRLRPLIGGVIGLFVITGSFGKSNPETWYCRLNGTLSRNNAEKRFTSESGPGTEYR